MTLTGRVETLETQVSFITQDLLLKTDSTSYSTLSINWNRQFDLLEQYILDLKEKVQSLQSLYTNLYITTQNNYSAFTGHTGQTGHG